MRLLVVLCLCVAVADVAAAEPADPADQIPVQVTWDQKIPMRDGVKLSGIVYRDPAQAKPVPAIVSMTPYMASESALQGRYFAQRGYVFVSIDLRGRGNSDGAFVPGQVEGRDGADAVEWVARQPWCDGNVVMWGGSWRGFTQWAITREAPPHLKAIVPTAAVYPGVDYPHTAGISMSFALRWLAFVDGRALNQGLFDEQQLWTNAEWQQVTSGRAFTDLDALTGVRNTVFRTWAAHPREDAFWQAITPRAEDFARLRIPVLTITGHYDGDQLGALTYYDRHMARGPREATARHWLVIGPWDHGGTRHPSEAMGGLSFGATAVLSMEKLHKEWYDHVLKGGPLPELLKDRVACFVMGQNRWIHASELGQIEGPPLSLALDATGALAGDVSRSGRLAAAPADPASVALTADPRWLPPREDLDAQDPAYLRDQRDAWADRPSRVVLYSSPFTAETVLAGRARLRLRVTADQPDADVFADLYEVLADGSAVGLAHAQLRLRYRNGGDAPLVPGRAEVVELPRFTFFTRSIAKGSRLRLVVDVGPQWGLQRNTHTGGDLATEPLSAARVAHVSIATGGDSGSTLELPRPVPGVVK
jgi:putative CocE/NonD family hydrolase